MKNCSIQDSFANGRYGKVLNFSHNCGYWVEAPFNREYMTVPITVECRVKLHSSGKMNLIISDGYWVPWKTEHKRNNYWMLYTTPETGELAVYLEDLRKPLHFDDRRTLEIRSGKCITDGQWHDVAMVYEIEKISLFIDGLKAVEKEIPQETRNLIDLGRGTDEGPLYIGGSPTEPWCSEPRTCDGAIEEIRISCIARSISGLSKVPYEADYKTIGLWRLDGMEGVNLIPDLSPTGNHARIRTLLSSLDENDYKDFGVRTNPFQRDMVTVPWEKQKQPGCFSSKQQNGLEEVALDGLWECIWVEPSGISEEHMLFCNDGWEGAISASVPCTVQTALLENGLIHDPMIAMNNMNISWSAEKEWWLRRQFTIPYEWKGKRIRLVFDGVDYRGTFWINGFELGQHEGMFGGPEYEISDYLFFNGNKNNLVVRLDPAPYNYEDTLKNNVAYGWHYVKLVTLGIWRSVRLEMYDGAKLDSPFLRTSGITDGGAQVDLSLDVTSTRQEEQLLIVEVFLIPLNFEGYTFSFDKQINVQFGRNSFGFSGLLEGISLWWPNGMGESRLYLLECRLKDGDALVDIYRCRWGARLIEMLPDNGGPRADKYNWQMIVNGKPLWVKGTNWCHPDALLRLDRRRNERFIRLAQHMGIQMFRVWGGGPAENDDFYDLCDEMGIMVQQEFSMLGYHRLQNIPSIHAADITNHMVKRLRNRPSLAVWTGANETSGRGRVIDFIGRRCMELDGTRPFHRSCPYGTGDTHYYMYFWGNQPLLDCRSLTDENSPVTVITEFGSSSPMNYENWERVIPEEERSIWPPSVDSVFLHHTPTYTYGNYTLMVRYAEEFLDVKNLKSLIYGMQLSQGLAFKLLIEGMRSRKPKTTAAYFYKLTENYPGCSFSAIDYYGSPKRAYYDIAQAFSPVHAIAIYHDMFPNSNGCFEFEVFAVNDTMDTVASELSIRFYNGEFKCLCEESQIIDIPHDKALPLGVWNMDVGNEELGPFFLCLDMKKNGQLFNRNWYYFAFSNKKGCLFERPKTEICCRLDKGEKWLLKIKNSGKLPAVSIEIGFEDASNTYYADKNGLWLMPGEETEVGVCRTEAVDGVDRELKVISVSAWNADCIHLYL